MCVNICRTSCIIFGAGKIPIVFPTSLYLIFFSSSIYSLLWPLTLMIESYGMSLECHDTWSHLLTSFLVEKDVNILWKCHDILMEFNRTFMRKRHPRKMPWDCHEIPMSFNGIKNFGPFWWYFYGKAHRLVMRFDVIFDQNSGNQ